VPDATSLVPAWALDHRCIDHGRARLWVATEGGRHTGSLKIGLVGPAVVEVSERPTCTRLVVDQCTQEIPILKVEVVGQECSNRPIAADTPLAPGIV
jgi:hypothetical protein